MDDVEEQVRAWMTSHVGPGTEAVLWSGPAARGHPDPGSDWQVHFFLAPESYQQDWAAGRRQMREVYRGRIVRALPVTFEEMGRAPWPAGLRFEFGTARILYDPAGRLQAFLRAQLDVSPDRRRAEALDCYSCLRDLWRSFGGHLQRGDGEAATFLAPLLASEALMLYFALHGIGAPNRAWLLPEFRRAAPIRWQRAVRPLLAPRGDTALLRAAVAHLVELGRDEVHEAFHISRGVLDAWGQDDPPSIT